MYILQEISTPIWIFITCSTIALKYLHYQLYKLEALYLIETSGINIYT